MNKNKSADVFYTIVISHNMRGIIILIILNIFNLIKSEDSYTS